MVSLIKAALGLAFVVLSASPVHALVDDITASAEDFEVLKPFLTPHLSDPSDEDIQPLYGYQQTLPQSDVTVRGFDVTGFGDPPERLPQFRKAYGKVVLQIGEPKLPPGIHPDERARIKRDPLKFMLANVIRGPFSSASGNYLLSLNIQTISGLEVAKEVLSSASWERKTFLWITTDEKYTGTTTIAALVLKGVLLDRFKNNTLKVSTTVTKNQRNYMELDVAQSFYTLVKQIRLNEIMPAATAVVSPSSAAILSILEKISQYNLSQNLTQVEAMQFVREDGLESTKLFVWNTTVDGWNISIPTKLTFTSDQSLFHNFDGQRFNQPRAHLIINQSTLPTGVNALTFLKANEATRKWIEDLEAKASPKARTPSCGEVFDTLLDVYAEHDAAAVFWAFLSRFRETLVKDDYIQSCLDGGRSQILNEYGLPTVGL